MKRICLALLCSTAMATAALADTMIVTGFVVAPTGPDSGPGSYGYDNAGLFGPAFASLGGLPFTVVWTGTDCNCYGGPNSSIGSKVSPITGAVLTINGVSLDLNEFNNIGAAEWLDSVTVGGVVNGVPHFATGPFLQLQTYMQFNPNPPWNEIFPTSQFLLATGPDNPLTGIGGAAYLDLADGNHPYPSNFFLNVTSMQDPVGVPAPVLGTGWPGLVLLGLGLLWWRRHGQNYC